MDGCRSPLPRARAFATTDVDLFVVTPDDPGDYNLVITLLQENIAWLVDVNPDGPARLRVRIC
jgi:hypothetical protein